MDLDLLTSVSPLLVSASNADVASACATIKGLHDLVCVLGCGRHEKLNSIFNRAFLELEPCYSFHTRTLWPREV